MHGRSRTRLCVIHINTVHLIFLKKFYTGFLNEDRVEGNNNPWQMTIDEQLQKTGPYLKVLNRSGSVARWSIRVFIARQRYKRYKCKTNTGIF